MFDGLVMAVAVTAFFLLGVWVGWGHEHKKRKELEEKVSRLRRAIDAFVCDDRANALIETVVWRVEHHKKGAEGDWKRIERFVRARMPLGVSARFCNTWFGYVGRVESALADDTQNILFRIRQQLREFSQVVREVIPDDAVRGGLGARTNFSDLVLQASQALAPVPESEEV